MIADVDTDSPREVFFRVAADMFADGNFNWGRVVALFYFASKLVLKVSSCRSLAGPGVYLRSVVTWVVRAQGCTLRSVLRARARRKMAVYISLQQMDWA